MQFDMFDSGQMGSEFYGFIYDLFEETVCFYFIFTD